MHYVSGHRAASNAVLVVGIYRADLRNTARATVAELSRSVEWAVEQRWLAIGKRRIPPQLAHVTVGRIEAAKPKFVLLNQLLAHTALTEYTYIVVCDDDVALPSGFLDDYLRLVCRHDFALSQPARTHDSYIDHRFVEQDDALAARRTQFVEIGPLFTVRRDAASLLLPFDEASPMGWGYDFVWPVVLGAAALKLGIVDATAIGHRLRKTASQYDYVTAMEQMNSYLRRKPHLSKEDAFLVVASHAREPQRPARGPSRAGLIGQLWRRLAWR